MDTIFHNIQLILVEKYYEVHTADSANSLEIKIFRYLKELLLRDYKIYEMRQKQGDLIPYHTHGYKEILVIAEGNIRMIVEEDIIDLKAGDMISIAPWAVHLSCFPVEKGAFFYLCHPLRNKK